MEFTLPLPRQLDKNGVLLKQWINFSNRFHCHQNSILSNGPSKETSSLLLFAANHHQKSVQESLQKYDVDSHKLAKVLEVVEQACLPSFLLLFERFRYFTLEQDASETLNDFINVMRKQVELCEFGDTKDSIMTNTLVKGVVDETFKQTLQNTNRLCFNDAVVMCSGLSKGSSTPSNSTTAGTSNNVGTALPPRKQKVLQNNKSKEDSPPKEDMYVMPIHMGLDNDDEDSDYQFFKTVLSAGAKRKKVKRKRRSVSGQRSTGHKTELGPKIFLCFQCNNEYASRKSFRRHIAAKHSDCSEYYCKHCEKTFRDRSECISHCMGHTSSPSVRTNGADAKGMDTNDYICWYCEERLPNIVDYRKHCLTHSAIRVFYCDLCQRKNHTLPRMIGHLKGHLSPRYKCEICANCFGKAELLSAHMQTHAEQPVHQCPVCSKNFCSADRLQGHIRTHSGEKRFTCELCGKSFCQKMSLEYHKRAHSGEKPYACDICGKRTASFGYLRKHKQMHSDKRPYVCEICGKSFRFISNLTRHNNGHTGKRAFACDVCGRTFIYREGLRDHIKAGRCPGRKHEGIIKRPPRAPRAKAHQHMANSTMGSGQAMAAYATAQHAHAPEALMNEIPHWQYMLRNNEADGAEGMVVVSPYY